MPHMWADTLQAAERIFLLRLIVWGAVSLLAGTALVAWLHTGGRTSSLLRHFAIQSSAWGAAELVLGAILLARLVSRDLTSATRLDRMLWMSTGLNVGFILVGATLLVLGWRKLRRPGLMGAGTGVIIHGLALVLLDLMLAVQISR